MEDVGVKNQRIKVGGWKSNCLLFHQGNKNKSFINVYMKTFKIQGGWMSGVADIQLKRVLGYKMLSELHRISCWF